jgi:hypothetical protein
MTILNSRIIENLNECGFNDGFNMIKVNLVNKVDSL